MEKYSRVLVGFLTTCFLAGCVTQNYESDKNTPVVQNESTNNEIAMTRISLGLGYLKMGNTTQAKLNLEKAKRFAPKLVQVYTAFAHYYDSVGEPEQAITAYEQALSLKPDDADTLNNYGVFLCKQEQYSKAEAQTLKAIAVPSYILVAQSYENLALCQFKAINFVKAELYLNKAIQHSPSNASSLLQMVRLQYAKGDYELAENYLKRYEKATRRFSANALALAYKVFEKQHNTQIAKNYGAMLVKMFPNAYETKQFLLNGLQEIEADELAKSYQETMLVSQVSTVKKRTIKLSPKSSSNSSVQSEKKPHLDVQTHVVQQSNTVQQTNFSEQTKKEEAERVSDENINQPTANMSSNEYIDSDISAESELNEDSQEQQITLPIHIVAKGDSLYSISKKYNIHMKAIERWNGFNRKNILKIGDVIYLANPKKLAK